MPHPDFQLHLLSNVEYVVSFSGNHQLSEGDEVRFVSSADGDCSNALTAPAWTVNGGLLDSSLSVLLRLPGGVDGTSSGLYALCLMVGVSSDFAHHPHLTARVTHAPPSAPPSPPPLRRSLCPATLHTE